MCQDPLDCIHAVGNLALRLRPQTGQFQEGHAPHIPYIPLTQLYHKQRSALRCSLDPSPEPQMENDLLLSTAGVQLTTLFIMSAVGAASSRWICGRLAVSLAGVCQVVGMAHSQACDIL
jgi:hypothetical protein